MRDRIQYYKMFKIIMKRNINHSTTFSSVNISSLHKVGILIPLIQCYPTKLAYMKNTTYWNTIFPRQKNEGNLLRKCYLYCRFIVLVICLSQLSSSMERLYMSFTVQKDNNDNMTDNIMPLSFDFTATTFFTRPPWPLQVHKKASKCYFHCHFIILVICLSNFIVFQFSWKV